MSCPQAGKLDSPAQPELNLDYPPHPKRAFDRLYDSMTTTVVVSSPWWVLDRTLTTYTLPSPRLMGIIASLGAGCAARRLFISWRGRPPLLK